MDADWKEETDNNGNTYKPLAVKKQQRSVMNISKNHTQEMQN